MITKFKQLQQKPILKNDSIQKSKREFLIDVKDYIIEDIIQNNVEVCLGHKVGLSEYTSWKNSLQHMAHVVNTDSIPEDSSVAIEYNIPSTSKRIDFIVSGRDDEGIENAVLIELKQWAEIETTDKDAIVITRFKGGEAEVVHPSYQAWSYSQYMYGFLKQENILKAGFSIKNRFCWCIDFSANIF